MATPREAGDIGLYWRTWTALLVLTAIMFFLDTLEMPRTPFVLIMLTAMCIKATLIAGIFMHLAHESRDLVIGIVVSVLGCGLILWYLSMIDARRILETLPA